MPNNDGGGKKRRYQSQSSSYKRSTVSNPQRGAPGILFTCETGRERKCRWEGLEILQHDWDQLQQQQQQQIVSGKEDTSEAEAPGPAVPSTSSTTTKNEKAAPAAALSLDDELALMKKDNTVTTDGKKPSSSAPFEVYDTGCRGTVFVLCTGCQRIVPPRGLNNKKQSTTATTPQEEINKDDSNADAEPPVSKKPKVTEGDGDTDKKQAASTLTMPRKMMHFQSGIRWMWWIAWWRT